MPAVWFSLVFVLFHPPLSGTWCVPRSSTLISVCSDNEHRGTHGLPTESATERHRHRERRKRESSSERTLCFHRRLLVLHFCHNGLFVYDNLAPTPRLWCLVYFKLCRVCLPRCSYACMCVMCVRAPACVRVCFSYHVGCRLLRLSSVSSAGLLWERQRTNRSNEDALNCSEVTLKKAGVAPPAGSARARYDVDRHVHSGRRVWNGGRHRFETFNLQVPLSYLSSPYSLNSLERTVHPKWNSLFPQTPCRLKVGWGFTVAKKEFRSFTAKNIVAEFSIKTDVEGNLV